MLYLISVAKAINDDRPRRPVALEAVSDLAGETDEHSAAWMSPEFIDAIARRVLELEPGGALRLASVERGLLTVAEVAARLNVSKAWVYAHKRDLGAIRLGTGPKARLRFDVDGVLEDLNRRDGSARSGDGEPSEASRRTRRRLVSRKLPRASRAA